MNQADRAFRTAPARNFNGGCVSHGKIAPMERPGLLRRIFRPFRNGGTNV